MNQAGITNLSVVQAPSLPYRPSRPRKLLLLGLALFAGLAGGLALCLLLEMLDDTIALPEQVEALTGIPLLAVVDQHGIEHIR
jgi:succinoglycan biosynthesis transport protein ExoP